MNMGRGGMVPHDPVTVHISEEGVQRHVQAICTASTHTIRRDPVTCGFIVHRLGYRLPQLLAVSGRKAYGYAAVCEEG